MRRHGYRTIQVMGREYMAHRVAWLIQTGEWPSTQVDHANCVKADNRWGNLRLATRSQNQANSHRTRRNRSGHKGVRWRPEKRRWYAEVYKDRKCVFCRAFAAKEDAIRAYRAAALRIHGEFARFD